jgi:hypothetical protein
MKKRVKKLSLHRETLRTLEARGRGEVEAGDVAIDLSKLFPFLCPSRFPCTNELSVCLTCTKPIDGCPDPTIA